MMKKASLATATAIAMIAASTPAYAGGVPVIDPGNIAQTVKVVKNGIQQVQQMKAQLGEITNLKNTLGALGKGKIDGILKMAGLDFTSVDSTLNTLKGGLPGIVDALPSSNAGKAIGISADLASKAKTSINSGREFALQAFYKKGEATTDEIAQRLGIRQAAMRDSVTAGYAMSLVTKNDLNKTETTMKALTTQVQDSSDLRTDVQSNTAVAFAQLQQLIVQNQLLAQMLEVQSTSSMAMDGNGVNQ